MITFAIGDVHGCFDQLVIMMEKIREYSEENDIKDSNLIFLGDYIDRGPKSKEVVDFLINLQETFPGKVICLRGNHEQMMLDHLRNGERGFSDWLDNGGRATLKSYDVGFVRDMPRAHLDWMLRLPYYHNDGLHFFVHAGVEPGKKPEDTSRDEMMWIRYEFLNSNYEWPQIIVHGHTPMGPTIYPNRVNCDASCCFRNGSLACAIFNDEKKTPIHWLLVPGPHNKG